MLNTPYERGWRAAANGNPTNSEDRGFLNGYRDCMNSGCAGLGARVIPCDRPKFSQRTFLSRVKERFGL